MPITGLFTRNATGAAALPRVKALAFDAFPIFDPRPIYGLAMALYPDVGANLANGWRIRQFEYQWLRAMSDTYADFWQVTEDALVFSARSLGLDLSQENRRRLMDAYLAMNVWPDVPDALELLGRAGIRLAFLSNATEKILRAGIKNSKLDGIFEHVLSTDRIRTYKPSARAYRLAIDAFGLARQDIGFVAFAGWDAAGAKAFGYPTFWTNRLNLPAEELGSVADASAPTLLEIARLIVPTS